MRQPTHVKLTRTGHGTIQPSTTHNHTTRPAYNTWPTNLTDTLAVLPCNTWPRTPSEGVPSRSFPYVLYRALHTCQCLVCNVSMCPNPYARNAIPSHNCSFKRQCLITSARESLWENLRSSDKFYFALTGIKASTNSMYCTAPYTTNPGQGPVGQHIPVLRYANTPLYNPTPWWLMQCARMRYRPCFWAGASWYGTSNVSSISVGDGS